VLARTDQEQDSRRAQCDCGNTFMDDSVFCRRCGAPRDSLSTALDRLQIMSPPREPAGPTSPRGGTEEGATQKEGAREGRERDLELEDPPPRTPVGERALPRPPHTLTLFLPALRGR
jgi:hypothetical protein